MLRLGHPCARRAEMFETLIDLPGSGDGDDEIAVDPLAEIPLAARSHH